MKNIRIICIVAGAWALCAVPASRGQDSMVGIGTTDPQDNLHIIGGNSRAGIMLSPDEPFSGDDAEIILTEDNDNTFNMSIRYDGDDNRLYFSGKNNAQTNGPHMGINRDNGRVGINTGTVNPVSEVEVVGTVTASAFAGDGSSLTSVDGDALTYDLAGTNLTLQAMGITNVILNWNGIAWETKPFARVAFRAGANVEQTVGDAAYAHMKFSDSSTDINFEDCGGLGDCYRFDFDGPCATPGEPCGYFVAPIDGVYFFEASILWDNANAETTRNGIFIRVANTDKVGSWTHTSGGDLFSTDVCTTLELNAGDRVSVRGYNGGATDMDTLPQSGKYVYFSGYLVYPQ